MRPLVVAVLLSAGAAPGRAAEPAFAAFAPAEEVDFSAFDRRLTDLERENAELRDRLAALEKRAACKDCGGLCTACGTSCPCAPKAAPVQLWKVPGGEWMTEADLRRSVPGVRFPHDPAPAVAVAPFVQGSGCSAAGCRTTPTTLATGAGPASTSSSGFYRLDGTSTSAAGAATLGSTDGCASGNCAAPTYTRTRLFRR